MPFCTNCGQKLPDGAKFCCECGEKVNYKGKTPENERKVSYDGNIHKCPNCGEILNSFVANCPSCGYELREKKATDSVLQLYHDLYLATTTTQKDHLIRNFPIPNSKEDIVEFMILASTNIAGEDEKDIYEAWLVKLEQAYQKAYLMFGNDSDFVKIQAIYENCQNNVIADRRHKIGKFTVDTVIRNVAVLSGIILMIIAIVIDRSRGNSSLIELVSYIVLIVSAASLFRRKTTGIDYAVGALSGLAVLLLSFMLRNGSMGQLSGGIILIIVAVNYFRSLSSKK